MLLIASLLLTSGVSQAKQQVLIYGDINYPPYSFEENGQPKGIYVSILRAVFSKMPDYEVTMEMIPWKRGLEYVKKGEAIAIFPPYYVEERTSWMILSEPILDEPVVIFGKKENLRSKVNWPEDFYGTRIGLNSGYDPVAMGGIEFAAACKSTKIVLLEAYTTDSNLRRLEAGRIQFYLNAGSTIISAYPSIRRGPVVNTAQGYLGFTKKEESFQFLPTFSEQFNAAVKKMKKSKEIVKIAEDYMK